MTNIRFTKKSRHPRRNNGGVSPGKKESNSGKLFDKFTGESYSTGKKAEYNNSDKKWFPLNFK